MQVLDNDTVVVSNSDELKEILIGDNNYNYIYFDSNITLNSEILINENKKKITIDGTYLGNRYTYTGINSTEKTDVIIVNPTNEKVILKNMDIISAHAYGVVYAPSNNQYKDINIEYNNIKFNGIQISYNPYGKTRFIDCNITIETTDGTLGQEVAESRYIEFGGNNTITSSSTGNSLFYYPNANIITSITFLPYSRSNLLTETKDFMNGTNKLNLYVQHDAEVNITTGNGFAAYTVCGVKDVLIDERATFNFIEKSHQRIPMWSIFGNFTVNEGASLYIINTYASTPSDNYNLHFKGTNQILTFNNPNRVVFYSKNANILYTNETLQFSLKFNRLNMWSSSTEFVNAGGINDLPEFSWYKSNYLSFVVGTITKTETTIETHNFSSTELLELPELTNFVFQNRKEFSIGTFPLNIHPITNTSLSISGHANDLTDVIIAYESISDIVTTDETGLFTYTLSNVIQDNTKVKITANIQGSFIYATRELVTPHNGELTMMESPTNIEFSLTPILLDPVILPKKEENIIKIIDSRLTSSNWNLYVHLSNPMHSINGYTLLNAVVFKKFDNSTVILNEVPSLVFTGNETSGDVEVHNVTWSVNNGLLLRLIDNALEVNEEYNTKVIWSIRE